MQFSSAVVLSAVAGSALAASNSTVTTFKPLLSPSLHVKKTNVTKLKLPLVLPPSLKLTLPTPPTAHCQPLKLQLHLLLLMFLPPLSPSPHAKKTNVTKPLSPPVSPLSLKVLPSTLHAHCHLLKLQVQLHLLLKNLNQLNFLFQPPLLNLPQLKLLLLNLPSSRNHSKDRCC